MTLWTVERGTPPSVTDGHVLGEGPQVAERGRIMEGAPETLKPLRMTDSGAQASEDRLVEVGRR